MNGRLLFLAETGLIQPWTLHKTLTTALFGGGYSNPELHDHPATLTIDPDEA